MKEFEDYDIKYPDLVWKIVTYFKLDSETKKKTVQDFCEKNGIKHDKGTDYIYQPEIVDRICKILCKKNHMTLMKDGSMLGLYNNYSVVIRDMEWWNRSKEKMCVYFNSIVYGFEYIYRYYKNIVLPLVWKKENGDYSVGSGFMIYGGIATAKHCITDSQNLSVKGFSKEELEESKIYISENPALDIAFIDLGKENFQSVGVSDGEILEDVIAMGYPKIPAFTDFLTVEKATISSKAESRLTPTKGAITAYGTNYLSRAELMLITAKIRGGNSGGPIINEEGYIVGIACQSPDYEGDYDDLGYGIAVPIKYLSEIVNKKSLTLSVTSDFFMDYID